MSRPDPVPMMRSLPARATIVFALCAATLLLAGTPSTVAQVGYTGVPSPPPADIYVGTYVGPASARGTVVAGTGAQAATAPQAGAARTALVGSPLQAESAQATEPGERGVVTGRDLVTIAALGLTGVVAFALSARRFRGF